MALSDKNILITPSVGAATDPTIRFVGADASSSATITLRVLNTGTVGTLSFEGSSGQLFSLSDTMSGTIFSVNDISGIPSIEVLDTGEIRMAQYSGFVDILSATSATSTNSGALQVVGGVGIGGNLYVGGTIFGTISGAGSANLATTSTNLAGGTLGQVPYQTAPGLTSFYGPGTAGQILLSAGAAAPVYTNTSSVYVGAASSAVNLFGGTTGQLHYQSAAGVTAFAGPGTAGQILLSNGAAAPVYTNTASVYVGASTISVNLFGGTAGQLHYQSAPGVTAFAGPGTAGQLLVSAGTSAPVYTNTASVYVGAATSAVNLFGGTAGQFHYQSAPGVTAFISTGSMYVNRATIADSVVGGVALATTATNIAGGTAGQVPYQTAAGLTSFFGAGTAGQILLSNGAAAPVYTNTASVYVGAASSAVNLFGGTAGQFAYQTAAGTTGFISTGSMYVNRAVISDSASGGAGQVNTIQQTANASYYPTFVDTNNATSAAELVYTTSSFVINPATGGIGIGTTSIGDFGSTTVTVDAFKSGGALYRARGTNVDGIMQASDVNSALLFGTRGAHSVNIQTNNTERIRINSSGQVGIGSNYAGTNGALFAVNGGAYINGITTVTDSLFINSTIQLNTGFTNKLNVNGSIVAGDGSSTNGTTILQGYYGTGALTVIGTNRSSGGPMIGYGVTPSVTTSNNFLSSSGVSLARSAIISDDSIRWYTAPATTTAIGSVVTLTERMRLTNLGGLSFGATGSAVGTAGQILQSNGDAAPTWVNLSGLSAGIATTATNIAGGTAGQVPYQTAAGATSFFGPGTAGQVLLSNGTSAPVYTNTGSIYVGAATISANQFGGTAGQLHYQSAPNVTAFAGPGTAGQLLVSAGAAAPVYTNTGSIYVGAATSAVNLFGGSTGQFAYQTAAGTTGFISTGSMYVNRATIADSASGSSGQITTTAQTASANYFLTFVDANNATAVAETVYTTSSFYVNPATGLATVGALTVNGNLTVSGTTTYVNSTVTNISDPIITIGGGTNGAAPTADDNKDRGIAFQWHNGTSAKIGFFGYDDSTGFLTFVPDATISSEVISGTKGAADINLAGGTAMSLAYQSAANTTAFLAAGTAGQLLQTNGTGSAPTWVNASGLTAATATTATNIAAGTAGQLHYQSAPGLTAFAGPGTSGQLLVSAGTSAPVYTNTASIYVGAASSAVNLFGGSAGQFAYQTAAGTTSFISTGSMYVNRATIADSVVGGSGQVNTIAQTSNATYYTAFVDSNNASSLSEAVYTTSSFVINPSTGNVGIGATTLANKLTIVGSNGTHIKLFDSVNASTRGILFGATAGDSTDYAKLVLNTQTGEFQHYVGPNTFGGFSTFYTNGSERLRITTNGGIGFGGNAPGTSGQILKSNGDAPPSWVDQGGLTSGSVSTIAQNGNASYYPAFVDSNNASFTAESVYTTSSFSINPSTGNVGLGSVTTRAHLDVNDGTVNTNGDSIRQVLITAASVTPSAVTSTGLLAIQSNNALAADVGGSIAFGGRYITADPRGAHWAYITGFKADATSGNLGGYLAFTTRNAAGTIAERLRITQNGGIAFGGAANVGTTGQLLQSNGDAAPTWVNASGLSSGLVNTIAQTGNATYYPTFVDSNNASSASELVYTTSSFSINAATGRVDATGLVSALGGYRNTGDYFEKVFVNAAVFPNGVANQAVDIRIGNVSVWGYIEVEITSTFASQNSAGKLTKVFAIGTNPTNLIYVNEGRVVDSMGTIPANIAIGDFQWDGTNTTYKIPVSHIVSTSNTYTIKVRCFGQNTGADAVLANTTISSVYTLTALSAHDGPYYNGNLMVGYTARQSGAQLSVAGGTFVGGIVTATNMFSGGSRVLTTADLVTNAALVAGTDTAVSGSVGIVTVWNTSTLQTITNRGSTTTNAINISNTTAAINTSTGALQVRGGVGIGGDVYAANIYTNNTRIVPTSISEFIATAGQNIFTIAGGYVVGTVQVFTNGLQLGTADFTASNGSTVTLAYPRNAGDTVRFIAGVLATPQIVDPAVLNDISSQFDGYKAVFPLKLDQNSISNIVDSKDLEVVINGQRLSPYVDEYRWPWITPYDSYKGFRVAGTNLIIYNAPWANDSSLVILRGTSSVTRQKRRYPYSATSIALGD
jgi:hypothetical protein